MAMEEQTARQLEAAHQLLAQGDLEKMIGVLEEVLFAGSANSDACSAIWELLHDLKKAAQWAGPLREAHELIKAGRQAEARALARKVHERDPTNQQALLILDQPSAGDAELTTSDFDQLMQPADVQLIARADCLVDACATVIEIHRRLKKHHFKRANEALENLLAGRGKEFIPSESIAVLREEIERQRELWWRMDRPLLEVARNTFKNGDFLSALVALDRMSAEISATRQLRRRIDNALHKRQEEKNVKLAAVATEIHQLLRKGHLKTAGKRLDLATSELGEDHVLVQLEDELEEARRRQQDRQFFELATRAFEGGELGSALAELAKMSMESTDAHDLKRRAEEILQKKEEDERQTKLKAVAGEIRQLLQGEFLEKVKEMLDRARHELGEDNVLDVLAGDLEKATRRKKERRVSIKAIEGLYKERRFEDARAALDEAEKNFGEEKLDLRRLRERLPRCGLCYKEMDKEGREVKVGETIINRGPRYVGLFFKNFSTCEVKVKRLQFVENEQVVDGPDFPILIRGEEERLLTRSTLRLGKLQYNDSLVSATALLENEETLSAEARLLLSGRLMCIPTS